MATWIVHLRIADTFIKRGIIPSQYKTEFILGSLAPDCGYGQKDSLSGFCPPPSVTHWAPSGCKIVCNYTKFYDTYIKGRIKDGDYYFYFGYYIHLLTDILWSSSIYMANRLKYAKEYRDNPEFINVVKQDWYGLDFLFLKKASDYEPMQLLNKVENVKDYLPYYEKGQLTKQIKYIYDYYKTNTYDSKHSFIYLTEIEMDEFIKTVPDLILLKLKQNE